MTPADTLGMFPDETLAEANARIEGWAESILTAARAGYLRPLLPEEAAAHEAAFEVEADDNPFVDDVVDRERRYENYVGLVFGT